MNDGQDLVCVKAHEGSTRCGLVAIVVAFTAGRDGSFGAAPARLRRSRTGATLGGWRVADLESERRLIPSGGSNPSASAKASTLEAPAGDIRPAGSRLGCLFWVASQTTAGTTGDTPGRVADPDYGGFRSMLG
jgi:hypothetical protein